MTANPIVHRRWMLAVSLLAVAFGLLTVKAGGTVLFGSPQTRAAAGNVVPFVLWFNFAAGFAYVAAGVGLWMQRRWALWLAIAIAASTAMVFAAFGVHVLGGGAYEPRTLARDPAPAGHDACRLRQAGGHVQLRGLRT